ncbi:MAG: hypothetical protein E7273_12360 [Pseudobutyrivibrio ruminis]|nr:hypothetical protein [Pseudobutyrivibrio ruminis]
MFDKFGEFNSAADLNNAAMVMKLNGDEEGLVALALENGIDREEAEDYMDGCISELTTELSAAIGKLKAEQEYLKLGGILIDWTDELRSECTNNTELCAAVRSKDKCLAGYIAALAEDGFKNKAIVHKDIVELAPEVKKFLHGHEFSIGVPDKATRFNIMRTYYLGGQQ